MKMKFKLFIPSDSEEALRSVLPTCTDTPIFDENDNVIGMITGGKRFGASNVFSLEAKLIELEKPNTDRLENRWAAGDVLMISDVTHIVTNVGRFGEILEVEPLETFMIRTRVVQHEGESMSIKDMLGMYCNEYIGKL